MLQAVYEDESHVHIVMEYCRGGELFHRMGKRHYSERTVSDDDLQSADLVMKTNNSPFSR
jgi:serine/threonine protein kinase